MIQVTVYDKSGSQVDTIEVDENLFGGHVREALLHQAVVMYHANRRQGTVATRSRGLVCGSTRKLFRQKGTGRARMGNVRTVIRRGGGVAFAKSLRDYSKRMPRKARRLATDSAILNKMQDNEIRVIDELYLEKPSTKAMASVLGALNTGGSCVVSTAAEERNIFLSGRNIQRTIICPVSQLNAYDLLTHRTLVITREAFTALLESRRQGVRSDTSDSDMQADSL